MSPGRNIERLIEGYVNGELSPEDHELVERHLADTGELGEETREQLKFEQTLSSALEVKPFEDDVAADVMARVHRRATTERKTFQDHLATKLLAEAMERDRRLSEEEPRKLISWPTVARVAAVIVIMVGLYGWIFEDPLPDRTGRSGAPARRPNHIGEVAYGTLSMAEPLRPVSLAEDEIEARSAVYVDEPVETDAGEAAQIKLAGSGATIALLPNTRVIFRRGVKNMTYSVRIIRGGFRVVDGGRGSRPILVRTLQGLQGQIRGPGEVHLVSYAVGGPRETTNVTQSIVVRTERGGKAEFSNQRDTIKLATEELGVINRANAVKLTSEEDDQFARLPSSELKTAASIESPAEVMFTVDGRGFTRQEVANEALRVYAADLFELMSRSIVVQLELRRLGAKVSPAIHADAVDFVEREDLMRIAPLRSSAALAERAVQVAGLITIAQATARSDTLIARADFAAVCDTTWRRLARRVRLDLQPKPNVAVRVRYGKHAEEISFLRAWNDLRRFVRVSEMRRVMADMIDRIVLQRELAARGYRWPESGWDPKVPPPLRAAQAAMVRMSGLTMRQYWDRVSLNRVLMAHAAEPRAAAIDRFLMDHWPQKHEVTFEHYFVPFCEAAQGFELPEAAARSKARASAESVARELRSTGRVPATMAASKHHGAWRNDLAASGPRTWWNEIYGRDFTEAVVSVGEGQVSAPVEGPEGYHVIRVLRSRGQRVDVHQGRQIARAALKLNAGRAQLDVKIKGTTSRQKDAETLLR